MTSIKIYTTPSCPWCKKTKEFLKQHQMKYTEIDVSSNPKAAQEMMKKSGQMGVPVLDVNGKIIVGFDPQGIQNAIAVKKPALKKKSSRKK